MVHDQEAEDRSLGHIHALQGVHGLQHHQALHGVLSFLPHQRGQKVPELQRGPGTESKLVRNISFPKITRKGEIKGKMFIYYVTYRLSLGTGLSLRSRGTMVTLLGETHILI